MNNSRWARGFTIIEVMIVLAIAGLILLIVFLAVPSLQRTSRNTQRKHDISLLAATIANFKSTNGVNLWLNRLRDDPSDATSIDIADSTNLNIFESVKLGFYDTSGSFTWGNQASSIFINPATPLATLKHPAVLASGASDQNHIDPNTVVIFSGENCNAAGTDYGSLQSTAVAIFYVLENGQSLGSLHCLTAN